jgi:hypothetical protein
MTLYILSSRNIETNLKKCPKMRFIALLLMSFSAFSQGSNYIYYDVQEK